MSTLCTCHRAPALAVAASYYPSFVKMETRAVCCVEEGGGIKPDVRWEGGGEEEVC